MVLIGAPFRSCLQPEADGSGRAAESPLVDGSLACFHKDLKYWRFCLQAASTDSHWGPLLPREGAPYTLIREYALSGIAIPSMI